MDLQHSAECRLDRSPSDGGCQCWTFDQVAAIEEIVTPPLDFDELKSHGLFAPRNSLFDASRYLYHYTRWE
jgi:hypothetical protein